jgi:nucleotide-binding universal stress UspA family protein
MIVVGVDGSESGKAALRFAAAEAALRDVKLRIVCVWHVPTAVYAGEGLPPVDVASELENEAKDIAAEALAEAGRLHPGIDREVRTPQGHPADMLVEEAEFAELLVVGTRGRGGLSSLLLGSVSQHVVHHAECPVVIVPHGRGVRTGAGEPEKRSGP